VAEDEEKTRDRNDRIKKDRSLKAERTRDSDARFEQMKKNLEQGGEKYRDLVERVNDGIAIIQDWKLIYVNPRLAEMAGCSVGEMIGREFTIRDRHRRRMAGEEVPSVYESAVRAKDGRRVIVEFNVNVSEYHGKSTSFVIVRDITERKRNEQIRDAVYRISEAAHSAEDLQAFYAHIHRIIAELMPAEDNFYIALLEADGQRLSFPYFVDAQEPNPGVQKPGKGLTEYVLRTGEPLLVSPEVFEGLCRKGEVVSVGPASIDWLGVPLKVKGRTVGLLAVQSYTPGVRFTEEDRKILGFIAEQVSMALERKRAAEALRRSEQKYRSIAENVGLGVYRTTADVHGRFIEANPAIVRMFGYRDREELMAVAVDSLYHDPEDRKKLRRILRRKGHVRNGEFLMRRKDGSLFPAAVCAVPVKDESGGIRCIDGIIEDITDRKAAEEKLKTSLREKEVLLREIHHRVKNNLQIISSLLNLQSRWIQDPSALKIFQESRDRVRSMALVHEKLYRSENLTQVDFGEYIHNLARHLFLVYGVKPDAVRLEVDARDVFLNINTSIPCGLIANELISNALKHAFQGREKGRVHIVLRPENRRMFRFVVSDDGVGLPEDVEARNAGSLGLQLVAMLVEQLQGKMEVDRRGGTTFRILFREVGAEF